MKKILMSVMVIAVAVAVVAGGSMAYFSGEATSTNNMFTAGTMSLAITSGPGASSVSFTNMAPGDVKSGSIVVTNTGSLNGTLYGRTTCVNSDTPGNAPNMDLAVMLDVTSWEDPTMSGSVNPGKTLRELINQSPDVTIGTEGWMEYGELAVGDTGTFSMTVEFNTDAGNAYQGDGINVTFEFLLTQAGAAK